MKSGTHQSIKRGTYRAIFDLSRSSVSSLGCQSAIVRREPLFARQLVAGGLYTHEARWRRHREDLRGHPRVTVRAAGHRASSHGWRRHVRSEVDNLANAERREKLLFVEGLPVLLQYKACTLFKNTSLIKLSDKDSPTTRQ